MENELIKLRPLLSDEKRVLKNARDLRRYHEVIKNDDAMKAARKAARKLRPRPKRTEEGKERERERARELYAERKSDPDVAAKRNATRRARHARNPEKKRSYDRAWIARQKATSLDFLTRRRLSTVLFKERHPDAARKSVRTHYSKHGRSEKFVQKRRTANKLRYLTLREQPDYVLHNRAKAAKWRKANKARKNQHERDRGRRDPLYRLVNGMRVRTRRLIRAARAGKVAPSMALIGCTPHDLRLHIESRFRDGMTWQNYGSLWHVDHVRAICSFDLPQPDQQIACFHWTNLQPLLVPENLRKRRVATEFPIFRRAAAVQSQQA